MVTELEKDGIRGAMGPGLFNSCYFIMGQNNKIVIVIPTRLPKADTYTVSVTDKNIKFKAGYEQIAEMSYPGGDVFRSIANNTTVGLVENPPNSAVPTVITNVAYVEVRRSAS